MRLSARDLSIGYRNHLVGSNIDLSLDPGEVLCLLGPNGAGKTTLFRTLLGLQRPLGGAVLLDARPVARMRPAEIARHMAYVPQAHATEFSYTALDVVLMGRTARLGTFASPGAADETIARAKLGVLGIGELADHDYTRISGGQRQLTLIARALAQETPILVMTKDGITHDTVPYFTERFEQAYITQLQDFVDNILQRKPPSISCADGVAALQASAAATLSFKENRPVEI